MRRIGLSKEPESTFSTTSKRRQECTVTIGISCPGEDQESGNFQKRFKPYSVGCSLVEAARPSQQPEQPAEAHDANARWRAS